MKTREQTVAIAFDLNFRHAAEIFSGASDYLAEMHLDWQLMPLNFGFETRLMELARSGQLAGALGTFVSDGWVEGLRRAGVPAINMFNFSKIESLPTVGPDDYATGLAAATHLRVQGAQSYAFLGADGVYYTRLREAGFKAGLALALPNATGHTNAQECIQLRPGPTLGDQLEQLKGRAELIGIFCSNDLSARELITLARQKDIHCGKDILVLGVDNDPSESIFAGIGISSFKQPIRETGYMAARALHQTIQQEKPPSHLQLTTPSQLIPRASSLASNRARIAQLAANTIRENLANSELDAASLAQRIGVSRRSLELATQEQFNTSPYQMLSQARLQLAQQLLRSTRLPIMEVGIRCGYPEAHHFSAWFKQRCQIAPKVYREHHSH
ncbi:substrate-binding domain-containing protein [Coraliomargarita sp. SDUM461004]|uniref:Substrate-binding domain-containing protein n=1 Tax=Thalassobacterium sedimentorum TaxID=3041258 RepID=A0ABU1AFH9_9BACT|nr:substrate-binding domain-containing protein [Coraliomargarita sp. SDUM461004]MDQ8193565.1 substrate-binding domain-containing protein [Coraliomargarita sp. SDUM461004]